MSTAHDHTAEQHTDYDPMIYDVMRESAVRLAGRYIWLSRQAETEQERQRLLEQQRSVMREADDVDTYDVDAVQAKRADFTRRLRELMDP